MKNVGNHIEKISCATISDCMDEFIGAAQATAFAVCIGHRA